MMPPAGFLGLGALKSIIFFIHLRRAKVFKRNFTGLGYLQKIGRGCARYFDAQDNFSVKMM
jgi:hypothetical protein